MKRGTRRAAMAGAMFSAVALMASGCGSASPTTTSSPTDATYVALGDSYTAFPGTSTQINAPCLRSSQNYPHLLAAALNDTLADMSCSGATTSDFTTSQKAGASPQFDALGTKTKLVTVSIGANDYRLSGVLLGGCSMLSHVSAANNDPCEVRAFSNVTRDLIELRSTLVTTYQAIHAKAPNAHVIVVGYPQILGTSGTCSKFPLASGDVAFINALNTQINAAAKAAAKTVGFEYLDVATASMSHGICSSAPWINGLKAVPGQALAVHPFANEQQAVAQMLEKDLKG